MTKRPPFKYFKTSQEVIRLAVTHYIRFPLSLRNVEDLMHERGIDISHETVRYWWHRFGPMFVAEIRKRRIEGMRSSYWRWHLDEVFVRINSELQYLWRAVYHEGEVWMELPVLDLSPICIVWDSNRPMSYMKTMP